MRTNASSRGADRRLVSRLSTPAVPAVAIASLSLGLVVGRSIDKMAEALPAIVAITSAVWVGLGKASSP